jgi:hypothetical protein
VYVKKLQTMVNKLYKKLKNERIIKRARVTKTKDLEENISIKKLKNERTINRARVTGTKELEENTTIFGT